jgi:PTS system ascorbate-specific IIA component
MQAMVRLVIVAHAPLASALHEVALHVYPDLAEQLRSLDVGAEDAPEALETRLRAMLPAHGEALVLTDVYGATPCNVALRLADGARVRVVAGVNVPMLWRALCYVGMPLGKLVEAAVSGGASGVMQLAMTRPQYQAAKGLHDDPVDTHDQ